MSYDYGREKFSTAVYLLATSPNTIQERIEDAFLSMGPLQVEEDLPEYLRAEFKALRARITREPAKGNEGTVRATTQIMTTEEAVEIAKKICDIASRLEDID